MYKPIKSTQASSELISLLSEAGTLFIPSLDQKAYNALADNIPLVLPEVVQFSVERDNLLKHTETFAFEAFNKEPHLKQRLVLIGKTSDKFPVACECEVTAIAFRKATITVIDYVSLTDAVADSIMAAITKKVDRIDEALQVYGTDKAGKQVAIQWGYGAHGDEIARRNGDGFLKGCTPEDLSGSDTILMNIGTFKSQKGSANGVATLDKTGKIPKDQLPAIESDDTAVAKQVARNIAELNDEVIVLHLEFDETDTKVISFQNLSGDITIDWGDGVIEEFADGSTTTFPHEYTTGKYICKIYGCTKVGQNAFSGINSIKKARLSKNAELDSYAYNGMSYCWYLEIPEGVKSLPRMGIASLGYQNSKNTILKLPDSLVEIGVDALYGMRYLRTLEIPYGVTKIHYGAFRNNVALKTIVFNNPSPAIIVHTSITFNIFNGCSSLEKILIKNASKDDVEVYKTATYWSDYADKIDAYEHQSEAGGSKLYKVIYYFEFTGGAKEIYWCEFYTSNISEDLTTDNPISILNKYKIQKIYFRSSDSNVGEGIYVSLSSGGGELYGIDYNLSGSCTAYVEALFNEPESNTSVNYLEHEVIEV